MENNIYLNKEGKKRMIRALNKVADSGKLTLGSKGANAILQEKLYPFHIITNDGKSIVEKAWFSDQAEQIGANILKEVSQRTENESGDGTTTSIVLTQAIVNAGYKSGRTGVEVKQSLDEILPYAQSQLKQQRVLIDLDDIENIKKIATLSAESEELGGLISEIYTKIGKEGVIELDNSRTYETFYEIKEGVRFYGAGFMSPNMINTEEETAVYKKPHILITEQKIGVLGDIIPIIEKLVKEGISELVIVCADIDLSVASTLVMNHIQGKFKTLIIKAPVAMREAFFEDIAKSTGATVVNELSGYQLKNIETSVLGHCEKIITSKTQTTLIGIADLKDHIESLKEKGDSQSYFRVNRLNSKVAILKLGSNSEAELSYLRLKAEDAINATKLALKDGVVVGGGIPLLNVSRQMPNTIGGRILRKALKAPVRQIMKNTGMSWLKREWTLLRLGGTFGYNASTREIEDLEDSQIYDPITVTSNALKNAISVASTVLTAEAVYVLPPEKKDDSPFQ